MTAREFIALKDLKDECWSQDTEQLAEAMEEYAKQKAWEAWLEARSKYAYIDGHASIKAINLTFEKWWEENK